jgi:hypothetical protein
MNNNRPSIDHSILSPSGRMSKAAREAAMKREASRLFPPGFWDKPQESEDGKKKKQAERLIRTAQTLRDLAARGMRTRSYLQEADKLDARAAALLTVKEDI